MVNALKKIFSPPLVARYSKSTKRSTERLHEANGGKSTSEADRVRALGALRRVRSRKKLAAGKQRETHFLNNEGKEKLIEDYIERETAGAIK